PAVTVPAFRFVAGAVDRDRVGDRHGRKDVAAAMGGDPAQVENHQRQFHAAAFGPQQPVRRRHGEQQGKEGGGDRQGGLAAILGPVRRQRQQQQRQARQKTVEPQAGREQHQAGSGPARQPAARLAEAQQQYKSGQQGRGHQRILEDGRHHQQSGREQAGGGKPDGLTRAL